MSAKLLEDPKVAALVDKSIDRTKKDAVKSLNGLIADQLSVVKDDTIMSRSEKKAAKEVLTYVKSALKETILG